MESGQAPTISDTDTAARVAAVIADWAPRSLSPPAAKFARVVVTLAAPGTPARAKALLFAAAKLAAFGESVGLELSAAVLLDRSVIERFVLTGADRVSPATCRTLRTNLRALARALERYPEPGPVPLPRERSKRPYLEGEIAAYLALAGAQRTLSRRMRTSALICLGAGAGLIGEELRHVTGHDLVQRSGGLLVLVGGRRARAVPVLERYHEPLHGGGRVHRRWLPARRPRPAAPEPDRRADRRAVRGRGTAAPSDRAPASDVAGGVR